MNTKTVIALAGLVGSGKSSIAQEIAKQSGAHVISGDEVFVELRRQGLGYEHANDMIEIRLMEYLKDGRSVVLDGDYRDAEKNRELAEKVAEAGGTFVLLRVTADRDVMIGRMVNEEHRESDDDFFGGASGAWHGERKGSVVKLREFWRRTPHHYDWSPESGGVWKLKELPGITATIDTTDADAWPEALASILRNL
jgi:predicted kinase